MLSEFIQKIDQQKLHIFGEAVRFNANHVKKNEIIYDKRTIKRLNQNLKHLNIPIHIKNNLTLIPLDNSLKVSPAYINFYRWQLWSYYANRSTMFIFMINILSALDDKHIQVAERLNYTVSNLYKLQKKFNQSTVAASFDIKLSAHKGAFIFKGEPFNIACFLLAFHNNQPIDCSLSFKDLLHNHLPQMDTTPKWTRLEMDLLTYFLSKNWHPKNFIKILFGELTHHSHHYLATVGKQLSKHINNPIIRSFDLFRKTYYQNYQLKEEEGFAVLTTLTLFYFLVTCGDSSLYLTATMTIGNTASTSSLENLLIIPNIEKQFIQELNKDSLAKAISLFLSLYPIKPQFIPHTTIYLNFSNNSFCAELIENDIKSFLNTECFQITQNLNEADLVITDKLNNHFYSKQLDPENIYFVQNYLSDYQTKHYLSWLIDHKKK